jgi:hypothetical protein
MSTKSGWLLGGVLLPGLLAAGCGNTGTVSGKVSYKGQPLGGGTILFVAPGQKTVKSAIAPDGSYTISGIPAGTIKIAVETKSAQPPDPEALRRAFPGLPKGAPLPPEAANNPHFKTGPENKGGKYVWIPDHYGDPEKSNLTVEVTGGNQQHDIELP